VVRPVSAGQAGGPNPDPFLAVGAAARWLGLDAMVRNPEQAIRTLARKRRLRSTRIAGKLAFRVSWLEEYANRQLREPFRRA